MRYPSLEVALDYMQDQFRDADRLQESDLLLLGIDVEAIDGLMATQRAQRREVLRECMIAGLMELQAAMAADGCDIKIGAC